jgi:hypothetical protein
MNPENYEYGLWSLMIVNTAVFVLFALSFFKPKTRVDCMLVRLTPKSTRFGDDFVGTLAHWLLARLSPLPFGCCHEPVYSPSYVGATARPLIPSNDRNALNG